MTTGHFRRAPDKSYDRKWNHVYVFYGCGKLQPNYKFTFSETLQSIKKDKHIRVHSVNIFMLTLQETLSNSKSEF